MEISYDYYRVFYYVARYGSFSKAAAALMLGQPNVTKVIRNLENQLGCKLFVRSSRGAVLTPEGEKLNRHVAVAYEHIRSAEREILAQGSLQEGLISMAITELSLYGAVLPALTAFTADYPHVKLRISSHSTQGALQALKNGMADFAVVATHGRTDDMFRMQTIREYADMLCCKKGYTADIAEEDLLPELMKRPYISLNRHMDAYAFFHEYLLSLGIQREPDIEVATAGEVLLLLKSGMGWGFLSEILARKAVGAGEIESLPLPVPLPARRICLVEDKSRSLNTAAATFAKYLFRK